MSLMKKLEVQMARNELLEKENQELRQEVARLRAQIISLKAHNIERKSILWKKIQNSMDGNNSDAHQHKTAVQVNVSERSPEAGNLYLDLPESAPGKEIPAKVPNSPPRPASATLPSFKDEKGDKLPPKIAPPPPPPPTPPKAVLGLKAVRRVPEVIELYRLLTRKDIHMENGRNPNGTPAVLFTRNMIEEIENRSKHLSAIRSDVQRHGEFISFLIKEVETTSFADISEVEAFVQWLDGELSSFVDERSVLRHFPRWPEQKADALREAACNYRDLKSLESQVSSFEDNPKEPLHQALRRIQVLQDRLERCVSTTERTKETTTKRYRSFHIPCEWMLDTGLISQIKLSSLKLGKVYMKRITKELESNETLQDNNLLVLGVRFAFRIHQFTGGFDADTIKAFQEMKKTGNANTKV